MKRLSILLIILAILFAGYSIAADYYVSPDGSGSTCSKASPCATSGLAWTTVDDETSTVYFMGGEYATQVSVVHNTTSNTLYLKPCSASPDPTGCDGLVTFTASSGSAIQITGSNVEVNGQTNASSTTPCDTGNTSSCNFKFSLGDAHGVYMNSNGSTGIKVLWSEFTSAGATTGSRYGIGADTMGTGTEFAYNYFHDTGHMTGETYDGLQSDIMTFAETPAYGVVLVHDNIFRAASVNYLTAGSGGVDFYNNYCDTTDAAKMYDIVHAYSTTGISYIRVYNNFLKNAYMVTFFENGSSTASDHPTQYIRFYNNVIVPVGVAASSNTPVVFKRILSDGGTINDVVIANNTFYTTYDGIRIYTKKEYSIIITDMLVENNIFYDLTGKAVVTDTGTLSWADDTEAVIDYNIFYGSSGFSFDWWKDGSKTTYTALAAFQTAHSGFTHNSTAQPSFTNAAGGVFTLISTDTAAKDAGINLSSYFVTDKTARTRPAVWDIGAYEYTPPPTYLPWRIQ